MLLAEKNKELDRLAYQQQQRAATVASQHPVGRDRDTNNYDRTTDQEPARAAGSSSSYNQERWAGSPTAIPDELLDHYKHESTKTRQEVETIKNMLMDMQLNNKIRTEDDRQRFDTMRLDAEKTKNLGKD